MAERSDGCSDEALLAPYTNKKSRQRKMTKDYCWTGVQESIAMFSKSWSDLHSFIKPGLSDAICLANSFIFTPGHRVDF